MDDKVSGTLIVYHAGDEEGRSNPASFFMLCFSLYLLAGKYCHLYCVGVHLLQQEERDQERIKTMKRKYFFQAKLSTGEYVDLIYESSSRRGTFPHKEDFWEATRGKVELADGELKKDFTLFSYILNEKNKDEQCFGENRIIDLR